MRNFNNYDIVFLDIDDTLISGPITRLMHTTWKYFHSNLIGNILMTIQEAFNLFKPNVPLLHKVDNCPVLGILTARKEHNSTLRLIKKLFPDRLVFRLDDLMLGKVVADDRVGSVILCELGTDDPAGDKWATASDLLHLASMDYDILPNCCIFDDNKSVRFIFGKMGYDAFDPTALLEEKMG